MKYRLVLFDFDGTLANSMPVFLNLFDQVAGRYKLKPLDRDSLESLRGHDARTLMRMYGVPMWKFPFIARHGRKLMAENASHITRFDGIDQLLVALAEHGFRLGILTSNSPITVRSVLGPQLTDLMEFFECGVNFLGKAGKLRNLIRASGLSPADAIYIGDQVDDIRAAQSIRMAAGAVSWGYGSFDAMLALSPSEAFSHVDDILPALRG
jgi:phosphoglycolate phosphatase